MLCSFMGTGEVSHARLTLHGGEGRSLGDPGPWTSKAICACAGRTSLDGNVRGRLDRGAACSGICDR
jgi:hypothetical protein